jgi:hypothetical protein
MEKRTKKIKFKDKYVLARGFPWASGIGKYFEIAMSSVRGGFSKRVQLNFPKELWDLDVPRYDLILQKVKKG